MYRNIIEGNNKIIKKADDINNELPSKILLDTREVRIITGSVSTDKLPECQILYGNHLFK